MVWHVLPINDTKEHEEVGTMCWCEPEILFEGDILVIHNSDDGRELIEQAEEILKKGAI